MNSLSILIRLLAGTGLGIFFYGGLWLTVQRLTTSHNPALLALGSFWIRSFVTLGGILLLMNQHWEYAAVILVGFTLGRIAISKFLPERRPAPRCT